MDDLPAASPWQFSVATRSSVFDSLLVEHLSLISSSFTTKLARLGYSVATASQDMDRAFCHCGGFDPFYFDYGGVMEMSNI